MCRIARAISIPALRWRSIRIRRTSNRLGHTHFWKDLNYSPYSYERFYPEIINAPNQTAKEALIQAKWAVDTSRLRNELAKSWPICQM